MKISIFWSFIVMIILAIILVFFYPKPAEICPPQTNSCEVMCECFGFAHVTLEQAKLGYIYCYGIPYKCWD